MVNLHPIWKDYFVDIDDEYYVPDTGLPFRVLVNSSIVYNGTAYPNPDSGETEIRVNDIVEPFLFQGRIFSGTYITNTLYQAWSLEVYDEDNDEWVEADSDVFSPDWSYEPGYNAEADGCNHPIIECFQAGQYVPISYVGSGTRVVYINNRREEGPQYVGDFDNDFRPWIEAENGDFLVYGDTTQTVLNFSGNANGHQHLLNLGSYPYAQSVEIDGKVYPVVNRCTRYILYYINAYGYWDSFPVYGKTKESDKVTRHTVKRTYYNGSTHARGTFDEVNELAHHFTFYTAWLTEAQSLRMHHLLNSPCVYVKDNLKNATYALVLTNSSTEYQKDGQLYQYTIEADLAMDRHRR